MLADGIGAAAAIWIAGGLSITAYVTAGRLAGKQPALVRWLAFTLALLWIATALFHVLARPRLFATVPAVVAAGILGSVSWTLAGGARAIRRRLGADAVFARRTARLVWNGRHRFWVLALAALAAPGLLRAIVLPPLGWDTLTYRAVKAAMWVQNGGTDAMIGTGPWGYYRNMLAGGEVFTAWAMLPLRADTLAGLIDVAQWLALGLAVLVLAREIGAREPFGSIGAAVVLALPTVLVLPGSGYVEMVLLATLIGSMALAIRGMRGSPGLVVLAGAGLGVSAATKFPMVPLGGALLVVVAVSAFLKGSTRHRLAVLAGAAAFIVALGPWLVLAYERTGAIFSPLPIRIGPYVLGYVAPELAWMMSRPIPPMPWFVREWEVLVRVFHPPLIRSEACGIAALVPLAFAPLGFARLVRRDRAAALLIGCAAIVSAFLYFSSGLLPVRVYWPLSSSRFLLPFVTIATIVAIAGCRSRSLAMVFRCLAVYHLAFFLGYGFSAWSTLGAGILAVGAAASAVAAIAAWRFRPAAVTLVAVASILGLSVLRDAIRYDVLREDFVVHRDEKDWAAAVPLVDRPEEPKTLAVTSGPKRSMDNSFAYPFLGRRLQNTVVYVPVSRDGAILPFGDQAAMEALLAGADFEAWFRRLIDRGVTEVISFAPASLELSWMDRRPDLFERLSGSDGAWGLYRLRREAGAPSLPRGSPGS